jgi:hypothetical protein
VQRLSPNSPRRLTSATTGAKVLLGEDKTVNIARVGALVLAAAMLLPATAQASPPTIASVQEQNRQLIVLWSLPPGMSSWILEVGRSPTTAADGSFFEQDRAYLQVLPPTATVAGTPPIPGGTYWVHVSAYENCATPLLPSCIKEFSSLKEVVVPAPPPPALTEVGLSGRHVTAKWSLPYWMAASYIEVATDPDVYADGPAKGAFLDENTVLLDALSAGQTTYTSQAVVPGGRYYVHMADYDSFSCLTPDAPTCVEQFSNVLPLAVPSRAPVLLSAGERSGHITASWTLPFGMENDYIEVATSPDVYRSGLPRGGYLAENVVLDDLLGHDDDYYESDVQLPSGTYYVHVADYSPATCPTVDATTCLDEFSTTAELSVPGEPRIQPSPASSPPAARPDKFTTFASLSVPRSQDVDRLTIRAAMAEAGTISASGTVRISKTSKRYRLKNAFAVAQPNVVVRFKLKLSKRVLASVKVALKRHRRVIAQIKITAKDVAGNVVSRNRMVELKK